MESTNVVEDKIFGRLVGKIVPDSVEVRDLITVSFDFTSKNSVHRFTVGDRVITKLFSLYSLSYRNLLQELREQKLYGDDLFREITVRLREQIASVDRVVVLLTDENINVVSIVSEQHKQLPMTKAFDIVEEVAKRNNAIFVTRKDTGDTYVVEYEIGRNTDMSVRVSAHLGRNDAMGRAGIHFSGGGHIFVCSNMIVPHIDADVKVSSDAKLSSVKIVHTTNVEEHLKEQLQRSFESARKNAEMLAVKFEESKDIRMPRALQRHCIELMRMKSNLPDVWNFYIKRQLESESETLYGLSQALTYVGTHRCKEGTEIASRLRKLGGQVVMLGSAFVSLIEKSLTDKGLKIPVAPNVVM